MSTQFETVLFHKNPLYLVKHQEQPFVPMKPVVEGMGLSWSTQYRKLNKSSAKFSCVHMKITASDGKLYDSLCVPLKKLNGWLFSINPEKVKPELKKIIELYQEECFQVLHDYWNKGGVVKTPELPANDITNFENIMAHFTRVIKSEYVMVKKIDLHHIVSIAQSFCGEAYSTLRLAKVVDEITDRLEDQSGLWLNQYKSRLPNKAQGA